MMATIEVDEMIDHVRQTWIARARNLGLPKKGKKRDEACLNFLCGALAMTEADSPIFKKMSVWVWLVSLRGAGEFENPPKPQNIAA